MAQVKTLLTRFKDTNIKKEYTVTITDEGYFSLLNGKPEDENPNPIADIHDDGSVKFYGAVSFADAATPSKFESLITNAALGFVIIITSTVTPWECGASSAFVRTWDSSPSISPIG